ncbi:hypothetical protein ZIOFF_071840 [Zingiber officinale]|uniref:Uncharacterized protein n=1 Tax=Zingiber officinale TaxID=94328 RepID=A0A8J5EQT4_ZINOF|nr:hypothetical protein ZIOFF_071840 [Zingiber officinale]
MVVMREVVVALTKFACTKNYLHVTHPQTIIDSDGARHLVQLVYYGKQVDAISNFTSAAGDRIPMHGSSTSC